jgi:hypothetical protein
MDTQEDIAAAGLEAAAQEIDTICRSLRTFHDVLPAPAQETSLQDLAHDLPRSTMMRATIRNVIADRLRPAMADLLAAATYQTERPVPQPLWNLTTYSAETQRLLQDLVVEQNFTAHRSRDPEDTWEPPYTPEQAGLKVYFEHGRWYAAWRKLEVPDSAPEAEQWEVLRLEEDSANPGHLFYQEV